MDTNSLNGRFYSDVAWNIGSLAVIGVAGIATSTLVARLYGPEILGAFGQVLALFTILAQAAVGGFVFGLLHHLPPVAGDREEVFKIFGSALYPTLALGFVVAAVVYLSADLVGRLIDSPLVGFGLKCAAPGLWLFAINKCLLYAINALRRMRLFAVSQALRMLLYFFGISTMAWLGIPGLYLPLALTVGEAVLLLFLYLATRRDLSLSRAWVNRNWVQRMIRFNRDGFIIGLLLDVNVKVDIIVLGLFMADEFVGLYVFMALFAEGFAQIPVVLQNNLNPLLSRLARAGHLHYTRAYIRQLHLWFVPAMIAAATVATLALPAVSDFLTNDPRFGAAWPIFAILAGGVAITAGFSPFLLVLNQIGRPSAQSFLILAIVLTNLALNVVLIPQFGLTGAAVATASTTMLSVPYLIVAYRLLVGRWL